jgi:hypothetical protein
MTIEAWAAISQEPVSHQCAIKADRNREDQELDWRENALNQRPDRFVAADALFGRVETDWIFAERNMRIHLALSLSTRDPDVKRLVTEFESVNFN